MIVSDGYETGDAALLGREMAALGRRCRRIVWLNPMIGWDGYAPEAAGMKAALPHVDLYRAGPYAQEPRRRSNPIWRSCDGGEDDRPCRRAGPRVAAEGRRRGLRARDRRAHRLGDRGQGRRQGGHPPGRHASPPAGSAAAAPAAPC